MATEDLYEVERIVDRRKTRKGRVEYLVRWRGYGSDGDTWEPESHLSTCMSYVHEFNRQQRQNTLLRSTRTLPPTPRSPPTPPTSPPRQGLSGDVRLQVRTPVSLSHLPSPPPHGPQQSQSSSQQSQSGPQQSQSSSQQSQSGPQQSQSGPQQSQSSSQQSQSGPQQSQSGPQQSQSSSQQSQSGPQQSQSGPQQSQSSSQQSQSGPQQSQSSSQQSQSGPQQSQSGPQQSQSSSQQSQSGPQQSQSGPQQSQSSSQQSQSGPQQSQSGPQQSQSSSQQSQSGPQQSQSGPQQSQSSSQQSQSGPQQSQSGPQQSQSSSQQSQSGPQQSQSSSQQSQSGPQQSQSSSQQSQSGPQQSQSGSQQSQSGPQQSQSGSQQSQSGPQQLDEGYCGGLMSALLASSARRSIDLSKTGIKILVPKSPMNSRPDSEESLSLEAGAQEAHQVPPEVALLQKPAGVQLGPGEERARMGTRPRGQNPLVPPRVPVTPAAMRCLNSSGLSGLMEAVAASGLPGVQTAVAGATVVMGKRRLEERSAFDKRLRFSVRQTESAYRYRDIVVKKQDGFTHILLSTKSSENNTLNPEVMKEIQSAMATAASDDSKLVLLGAVGSIFCCGLDFLDFIRRLADDRKKESIKMAETIRTFINTFIQFRKPIVAAVNGPALGLGAALLPLCDVVWANEKAWFQTPYTAYGQTPDGCSSFTFPRVMGVASASELLLGGRRLTAQEACLKGLVSQVMWPGTFSQEVLLRIRELVSVDPMVLRESKALMRSSSRSALEQANERECEALKRVWGSSQGTDSILQYLQRRTDLC